MRKKEWMYLFILVWMVFGIQLAVNAGMKDDDQLIEAFHEIKTIPVESDVEAYGYFGDMYLSGETKKKMLQNLADKLDIKEGYLIDTVDGGSFTRTSLIKDGAYGKTQLQLITLHTENADGDALNQQYVYATITIYNSVEHVQYYRRQLEKIFADIGMKADVNIYLAGEMHGRQSKEAREKLIEAFLDCMDAKEVCGNRTDDLYTIYGYTRHEREYVYQNGERVNVNIALTYDETQNKTKIHMAVPFISKSY